MNAPTPKDFFTESPPQRTIGTEAECDVQTKSSSDKLGGYLTDLAIKNAGYTSVSGYLENGYRLYVDGHQIEVDTPECLGPEQAAIADLAGVVLLQKVVAASGLEPKAVHRHTGTVVQDVEETSGYHENYLIPRDIALDRLMDTVVASHLTSRAWSGAGQVGRAGFELWQKATGIGEPPITRLLERRTPHGKKPMAMIPPVDNDTDTIGNPDWARLEVRFADAGLSPYSRYMSLATTSIVLRLIEHSQLIDNTELVNMGFLNNANAARIFSRDLTFTETAETQDHSVISAVDYQEMLALNAHKLSQVVELPEDEVRAIGLWLTLCDELRYADLEKGEYGKLIGLLDFAPRHRYLTGHFPGKITSYDAKVRGANLAWDTILPEGGASLYWKKFGKRIVDDNAVQVALTSPPNTRASLRGKLIKEYSKDIGSVSWSRVSLRNGQRLYLTDPYASATND